MTSPGSGALGSLLLGSGAVGASLLALGVALFALAAYAARRREGVQASAFAVLLGSAGVGAVGRWVELTLSLDLAGLALAEVATVVYPVAWLVFALEYTGREEYLRWPLVGGVAAAGLLAGTLHVVDEAVGLPAALLAVGLLGLLVVLSAVAAGIALVLASVVRYDYVDTSDGVVLSVGVAAPLVGSVVLTNALGAAATGELVGYALLAGSAVASLGRGRLFEVTPVAGTMGRAAAFEDVRDAVFVLDEAGRIADVNQAAEWTLGAERSAVAGESLSAVFGDRATELLESGRTEFVWGTPDGPRRFEATTSPVTDDRGARVGTTLVVRDVTERVTREQRIEVLNRVLRHNVRNVATTGMLTAELVAEGEEPAERALEIRNALEDLADLTAKARTVEEVLESDATDETAAVGTVLRTVAEDLRAEFPGATVAVERPDEAAVGIRPTVLEFALRNLGENALEHNDGDDPRVDLAAEVGPDTVTVGVRDNGGGIPDHELQAIASGSESPLSHATGFGLWAVNWVVTASGGDVAFAENDPSGTVVEVILPRANADAEEEYPPEARSPAAGPA